MAGSELTRDQLTQLNAITPILPDDEVARMSRHEAKNYRDLLTARDQAEAWMVDQNQKGKQSAPSAVALAEAEPLPDDLMPPTPASAPAPIQVQSEIPADTPPAGDPVETDIPAVAPDPADIAEWADKLKKVEQRYKAAQAALSPAQQHAASLRKKLSESERESDALRLEFQERMDRIESLLTQRVTPPTQAPTEVDPLAGLAEVDPDLDQRLRALTAGLRAESQKQIDALNARLQARELETQEAEGRAFRAEHDAKVSSMVPDFKSIIGTKEGLALVNAWMQTQPLVIRNVLENPYGHTPHDVAYALNQFRASQKGASIKKPSLGDLATNLKLSPVTPLNEQASSSEIFSDSEMNNLQGILLEAQRKGGDMDAILAKAERTLAHKQKTSQRR